MHPTFSVVDTPRGPALSLPGLVTAHSHAFQRALRGQTQRAPASTGTFWSWREAMYALADALTPETIYAHSRAAFDELRACGVACVGEFHYVHHQPGGEPYAERTVMADRVIQAALDAGLRITLLRVLYARAGAGLAPEGAQKRYSDPALEHALRDVQTLRARWQHEPRVRVGVAPHSVRAVPLPWLRELGAAVGPTMPVHMHVAEQQGEVDACLAEHARRPVELLSEAGLLDARFCAVHATCLAPHEARLLGEARAFACLCPTTERDLGDGLAELTPLREAGARLCTGIDSHVLTDPFEELRALETHERLRLRRRVTFVPPGAHTPAEQLLLEGSVLGARALGWLREGEPEEAWTPRTLVHFAQHPSLRDVSDRALWPDALVFSGAGVRGELLGGG